MKLGTLLNLLLEDSWYPWDALLKCFTWRYTLSRIVCRSMYDGFDWLTHCECVHPFHQNGEWAQIEIWL